MFISTKNQQQQKYIISLLCHNLLPSGILNQSSTTPQSYSLFFAILLFFEEKYLVTFVLLSNNPLPTPTTKMLHQSLPCAFSAYSEDIYPTTPGCIDIWHPFFRAGWFLWDLIAIVFYYFWLEKLQFLTRHIKSFCLIVFWYRFLIISQYCSLPSSSSSLFQFSLSGVYLMSMSSGQCVGKLLLGSVRLIPEWNEGTLRLQSSKDPLV